MHPDDADGVTLGEVNRNVSALREDVRDITGGLADVRVSVGKAEMQIDRLDKIVYGALATGTAAFGTAIAAIVTSR